MEQPSSTFEKLFGDVDNASLTHAASFFGLLLNVNTLPVAGLAQVVIDAIKAELDHREEEEMALKLPDPSFE